VASEQEFNDAADRVKKLTSRPSNDELLSLYSLYKQATAGDVSGKRPGAFKMKDRAKFDAWTKIKGKSTDDARDGYVALVQRLEGK
jgi:diazepam-binding inhibitor (GABA receptor modulator, acyl-CoA-binding protein)